jgi:hypothetical protein
VSPPLYTHGQWALIAHTECAIFGHDFSQPVVVTFSDGAEIRLCGRCHAKEPAE